MLPSTKSYLSLAALSCVAAAVQAQQKTGAKSPNIVYIMCDDHAFQCISAYRKRDFETRANTQHRQAGAARNARRPRFRGEFALDTIACVPHDRHVQQPERTATARQKASTPHALSSPNCCNRQATRRQWWANGTWDASRKDSLLPHINDQGQYYNPQYKGTDTDGKFIVEEGYSTDLTTDHALDFIEHRDTQKPFCLPAPPSQGTTPQLAHANTKNFGAYDNVTFRCRRLSTTTTKHADRQCAHKKK